MKDKYDEAVEYLTENPGEIRWAWGTPRKYSGGCLFQFATRDGGRFSAAGKFCGCLTEIRGAAVKCAESAALAEEIRADERIPESETEITVESLPVFAEWQRRIDRELRGVGVGN